MRLEYPGLSITVERPLTISIKPQSLQSGNAIDLIALLEDDGVIRPSPRCQLPAVEGNLIAVVGRDNKRQWKDLITEVDAEKVFILSHRGEIVNAITLLETEMNQGSHIVSVAMREKQIYLLRNGQRDLIEVYNAETGSIKKVIFLGADIHRGHTQINGSSPFPVFQFESTSHKAFQPTHIEVDGSRILLNDSTEVRVLGVN